MDILSYILSKSYTDKQIQEIISAGFKVQVEQDRSILETTGEEKTLYLLPKASGSTGDGYDEFVYAQNNWEWVGKTDVDLSNYALKTEVGDLSNLPTTDKSSLVAAVSETFTNVSSGKALVASAITDKGVQTSSDATFATMAQNIEDIQTGSPTVSNPALVLWDWEGTKLAEYSAEDALALTELPAPSTLPAYADVDHELLTFQGWNWALSDIKTWINNHKNKRLEIGASYNTTDGQDHSYWKYSRINNIANAVSIKKHAVSANADRLIRNYKFIEKTTIPYGVESLFAACMDCFCLQFLVVPTSANKIDSITQDNAGIKSIILPNGLDTIGDYTFRNNYNLKKIIIPDTVETLGADIFRGCLTLEDIVLSKNITILNANAFYGCYALSTVDLPNSLTNIRSYVFYTCDNLLNVIIRGKPNLENVNSFHGTNANLLFYVSQADLSWFETATNWSTFYAQNKIVTIEDNIEYLESIGIDVDKYKEAA